MKTTILAFAALLATAAITPLSVIAQPVANFNIGAALPYTNAKLQNANGNPVTLKEAAKQNGLLVMFSCNTCPYVIKNQPITNKVIEAALAHNVGVIIINSNEAQRDDADSYEAMVKYAKKQHYTVPYVVDANSTFANTFGTGHTPEVFLFNNKNKLVYKGAMNDNPSDPGGYKRMYVEDAINAMIAGKEIDPSSTKSIGCGIKRKA